MYTVTEIKTGKTVKAELVKATEKFLMFSIGGKSRNIPRNTMKTSLYAVVEKSVKVVVNYADNVTTAFAQLYLKHNKTQVSKRLTKAKQKRLHRLAKLMEMAK